jgi:copper transport protein
MGGGLLLWVLLGAVQEARARWRGAILLLGVAVALVDAAASHAIPSAPPGLSLGLNALHEGAMAVWLGGLIGLAWLLTRPALAGVRTRLVAAFGRVAALALVVLVASGLVLASLHLSSLGDLISSTYGAVLGLKAVAAGVAVATALVGLRSGRSWRAEVLALTGVVALAGLLVSLPPPR